MRSSTLFCDTPPTLQLLVGPLCLAYGSVIRDGPCLTENCVDSRFDEPGVVAACWSAWSQDGWRA